MEQIWEHAPAAEVPPSRYRSDLPQRYGKQNGNTGFVWSSVLWQIQRDGGPVRPWCEDERRAA